VGLINDDTGPVQQVHLGLLAVAEVADGVGVSVRETDRLEGRWEPLSTLRAPEVQGRMEEWSRHALDALDGGAAGEGRR
jgi:predicted NUDIX family phosphoesterase